jgi:hypothetical protein
MAALQLRWQIKHYTVFYAIHILVPINGPDIRITG